MLVYIFIYYVDVRDQLLLKLDTDREREREKATKLSQVILGF